MSHNLQLFKATGRIGMRLPSPASPVSIDSSWFYYHPVMICFLLTAFRNCCAVQASTEVCRGHRFAVVLAAPANCFVALTGGGHSRLRETDEGRRRHNLVTSRHVHTHKSEDLFSIKKINKELHRWRCYWKPTQEDRAQRVYGDGL